MSIPFLQILLKLFRKWPGFKLAYESTNISEWSYSSRYTQSYGSSWPPSDTSPHISLSTQNGILTSPYRFYNTQRYKFSYTVSQPIGNIIYLNFINININIVNIINRVKQVVSTCNNYLEFRDGPSAESTFLLKICDNQIPAQIQTSQNHLWMR